MFHFTIQTISRRRNYRMIAAAAYRSGSRLYDYRSGQISDFTRKKGIVHCEILLPPNAPSQFRNREILWNAVDAVEKRKDARLAREAEFALPKELTLEEQIELAKRFVYENFVSLGMCADLCIHHSNEKNPHAHVLLTDRPIDRNGFVPKKDRNWNKKELIRVWREAWAKALNREYERKGLSKRVSHESYKTRGITDRKPTKHLGRRVLALAARDQMTDRILEHLELCHNDAEKERFLNLIERYRENENKRKYLYKRSR